MEPVMSNLPDPITTTQPASSNPIPQATTDSLAPTLANGVVPEALASPPTTPYPIPNVAPTQPTAETPAPVASVPEVNPTPDPIQTPIPDPVHPLTFEQRMSASVRAKAIELEDAGKRFEISFRVMLEHAFEAHYQKFAGNISDFETNVKVHIEELLSRVKKGLGFVK